MNFLVNLGLTVGTIAVAIGCSWPLSRWMLHIFCPDQDNKFDRFLHRVIGRSSFQEQNWKSYAVSLMIFNVTMFALVWLVLALQQVLPLNPDKIGRLAPDLIYNTVSSFVTNTNLQHYSGESMLSYNSQIFGIMWLQFVSAATGMAAFVAVCRYLSGRTGFSNFYFDLGRATLGVLIPATAIVALLLVISGVPMTFEGAVVAHTLEGAIQRICRGPVAAVVAIKQLGTNGGGFFGPNATHPLENVNFYSNLVECVALIVVPMACVWFFGLVTRRRRDALVIFGVMLLFLAVKIGFAVTLEQESAAALRDVAVVQCGNIEGKELRLGVTQSPIWATFTTCTSNGAVNSMHSSLNPLTSLVPLAGMWLNVTFGGIGVGFLGMFAYIIVTVFISGMMVGRTPEYLGKKVETSEMKLAIPILLLHPLCILGGLALFCLIPAWGAETVLNPGFHGFSEMLYEFTSASANNGSGFEGLGDNTVPWNIATGTVMLLGRFIPIVLALAIAGQLSAKPLIPETSGTLRTDTWLFGAVLTGVVLFIGALLFLPVAVLGPVAEYLTTLGV